MLVGRRSRPSISKHLRLDYLFEGRNTKQDIFTIAKGILGGSGEFNEHYFAEKDVTRRYTLFEA